MQFDDVKKAMIQVVKCHFEEISCFLPKRNCDFFQVDKATIQVAKGTEKSFSLERPKFDFGYIEKAIFQVVAND